jgi:hypothetical protein
MSRRNLSEALAARSPLARREAAGPTGTPGEHHPGSGAGEPDRGDLAPVRPDASDIADGTVANRRGQDDERVVSVAARPATPRDSAEPPRHACGTREVVAGQEGQAALERWVDAQRELWEAWFSLAEQSLPALSPGLPVSWGQPVLRTWQLTTRALLDAQATWLRCWAPPSPGRQADPRDRAVGRSRG